jgi:hypothetical protein
VDVEAEQLARRQGMQLVVTEQRESLEKELVTVVEDRGRTFDLRIPRQDTPTNYCQQDGLWTRR